MPSAAKGTDLTDPTDWLPTSIPQLSALETALRCQVCKDFYDTPVLTSCSHTFCSLCIRRCLSSEGRCPTCRASDQASKLRRNWAVEEAVGAFGAARGRVLEVVKGFEAARERERGEGGEAPRKRRRVERRDDDDAGGRAVDKEEGRRTTRSQSKKGGQNGSGAAHTEPMVIDDGDEDDEYVDGEEEQEQQEQEPDDGLVPCPMCGKRMKEESVFAHLDRCDEEQNHERAQKAESHARTTPAIQRPPSRPPSTKPQERLPELNYSLLKDNAMRKKLSELGIPNWGSKPLMVRRHTEWVNLWNSNCDSTNPRTKRELLHELDSWERSQGGHAREGTAIANGIMKKDFDSQGWAASNKTDFDRLIEDARRKRNALIAKTAAGEETEASKDQEDDQEMNQDQPTAGQEDGIAESSNDRPYEDNEQALSSVREKVKAANAGEQPDPLLNRDFRPESGAAEPASSQFEHKALLTQAKFGHETNGNTGMSDRWQEGTTRKVPMFQVPEDPIVDMDGQAGH